LLTGASVAHPPYGPRCPPPAPLFFLKATGSHRDLASFPTRRSSDLVRKVRRAPIRCAAATASGIERCSGCGRGSSAFSTSTSRRSEEHTSELQSRGHLVCRLLLEKK